MVALPELTTTTADLINKFHEDNQGDSRRIHLGGSQIGKICERELWYIFRWVLVERHEGRLLRLFERGQLEEERFVRDLKGIGVEVQEVDPVTGDQWRVSMCGGHVGGSEDGKALNVPEAPKTWHLIEMKTHGDKPFQKLKTHDPVNGGEGIRISKPQHYDQMQLYMGLDGLTRGLYMGVNKNNDELYIERIKFDPKRFEMLSQKAERVVFAERAPLKKWDNPSRWDFDLGQGCKYCSFKDICHGTKQVEVNCRTCMHVTPEKDGTWSCAKYDITLTDEQQRAGCDTHLYNPDMVNSGRSRAVEYGDTFVLYEDGTRNVQGGALI